MSTDFVQITNPGEHRDPGFLDASAGRRSSVEASPDIERPKTFYIETFGFQMNVPDSEKKGGGLMGPG